MILVVVSIGFIVLAVVCGIGLVLQTILTERYLRRKR